MKLQDQTALITGGGSGIGRKAALLLAREGAFLIISGRNAARGADTVAAIEAAGGKACFVVADLSDSVRSTSFCVMRVRWTTEGAQSLHAG
jgi:NAD(P)-dependent dehydrogenase (short-subunit alcohol dehydrogenase family)